MRTQHSPKLVEFIRNGNKNCFWLPLTIVRLSIVYEPVWVCVSVCLYTITWFMWVLWILWKYMGHNILQACACTHARTSNFNRKWYINLAYLHVVLNVSNFSIANHTQTVDIDCYKFAHTQFQYRKMYTFSNWIKIKLIKLNEEKNAHDRTTHSHSAHIEAWNRFSISMRSDMNDQIVLIKMGKEKENKQHQHQQQQTTTKKHVERNRCAECRLCINQSSNYVKYSNEMSIQR